MGREFRTRLLTAVLFLTMLTQSTGCANQGNTEDSRTAASDTLDSDHDLEEQTQSNPVQDAEESASVTEGGEEYRGFTLDNVLHSESEGDIHFNLYIPDSYDGSRPYPCS